MRHLIPSSPLLRAALIGDAAVSAGMGLLLAAAAQPMASLLVLLPYAGLVAWLGVQSRLPRWMVRSAIGVNLLWAVDSLLLLALGFAVPNALGTAFVLLQTAAVLGFALLQGAGLRRSAAPGSVAVA